jgi:hypothetical protein
VNLINREADPRGLKKMEDEEENDKQQITTTYQLF